MDVNKKISQFNVISATDLTTYVPVIQGSPLYDAIITPANLASGMTSYFDNLYIKIDGSNSMIDVLKFNQLTDEPLTAGQLAWNATAGTLDIGMNGGDVIQSVGLELYFHIQAQEDIANGDYCEEYGTSGNSGKILAQKARSTTDFSLIIGVATENILKGNFGFITWFGKVSNIDTTGSVVGETWFANDRLYRHPSLNGKLTKVKPLYGQKSVIAIVINAHANNGNLFVRFYGSRKVSDLDDVYITNLQDKDVLVYSTSGYWYNTGATFGSGSAGLSGSSGTDGTSGSSGTDGTSGSSGTDGTSGSSGTDGTSGTSGISGTDGTSGISGSSGVNGTSGTDGTSGVNGTSGTDGTSGISGTDGTSGISGSSGVNGTSGTDGTSGVNGTSGTNGSDAVALTSTGLTYNSYTATLNVVNLNISGSITGITNGTSGTDGTSGTSGISGTSGSSGVDGTSGANGTSGTNGGITGYVPMSDLSWPTPTSYDGGFKVDVANSALTYGFRKSPIGIWSFAASSMNRVGDTTWEAEASGESSFSFGRACVASGPFCFAMGDRVTASGEQCFAAGGQAITASGKRSFTTGESNQSSGYYTFTANQANSATGSHSAAINRANAASGYASTALGGFNVAQGLFQTVVGYRAITSGSTDVTDQPTDVNTPYFMVGAGTGTTNFTAFSVSHANTIVYNNLSVNSINGATPLSGTKEYYVASTSGGSPTTKLTFVNGILVSET